MTDELIQADLCVIGAGAAGLSVAAGASQMGARVVLIERGPMGGECLNAGCVPSKALIAAAHAAETLRRAGRFGIAAEAPRVDRERLHAHVRDVIETIAPADSVERYEGFGVRVLRASARFTGPTRVETDAGDRIEARRVVIATGSRPAVPPVPGLAEIPFLTNETLFERPFLPEHLLILGGGPIGCEMAQAFRRLGSPVTLVDLGPILPKEDAELSAVVRAAFDADGVRLHERVRVVRAERAGTGVALVIADDAGERRIEGSDLLVAAGREPVLEGLDLEAAGIALDRNHVRIDARLRSATNRKVFIAGDAAGPWRFTHVCGHHAGVIIKNALFRIPAKVDYRALPWSTFTDPELAQVGLTEARARQRHGHVEVVRVPFLENDRAATERRRDGLIKLVLGRGGRVLGAGIVGPQAGELIHLWTLVLHKRLKIGDVATMIAPYPTLGEVSKRAAGAWYAPRLFGKRTRFLVRLLARLG